MLAWRALWAMLLLHGAMILYSACEQLQVSARMSFNCDRKNNILALFVV